MANVLELLYAVTALVAAMTVASRRRGRASWKRWMSFAAACAVLCALLYLLLGRSA